MLVLSASDPLLLVYDYGNVHEELETTQVFYILTVIRHLML